MITDFQTRKIFSFTATCAGGLEDLVAGEIGQLTRSPVQQAPGAVFWEGGLADGYELCLRSRFASRILLTIAKFDAPDADTLYRNVGGVEWGEHFRNGAKTSFAVDCTLAASNLSHSRYAALRVKDAIVDQFRDRGGQRPSVDRRRPDLRLHLHINRDRAVLAVDFSGHALHRRGYRVAAGQAPLKESLAAAIASLALDGLDFRPDFILDPMCGSGTLLIEAALLLGDSAPGLSRRSFGFSGWQGHDEQLFQQLVSRAVAREEAASTAQHLPRLIGYDADPEAIAAARANIRRAGLGGNIEVQVQQLADLQGLDGRGVVLVNPPYGERLSDRQEVKYLYRCLGRKIRLHSPGSRFAVLTANPDLADEFGVQWYTSRRLYNGPLVCRLFVADVEGGKKRQPATGFRPRPAAGVQGPEAEFANRLRKKCKVLCKWASQHDITCFRVYDADIPHYNFAIDIYGRWIHVQEYAPPPSVDPERAATRFREGLAVIREVLGVGRSDIFIKTRRRQQGKNQYTRKGKKGRLLEVREGDCRLLVNLSDYLDTGLFLDHRKTRAMIRKLAHGKHFLNLFGYTGAATIHAAMGGAKTTTTVDLSEGYLDRARANLALNGFGGPAHRLIRAECLQWVKEQGAGRYDLIFLDPPTFSNTRKKGRVFDVQRHHAQLVTRTMELLAKENGLLIFSSNFRRFQLDDGLMKRYAVREISNRTLPRDFRHNPKIHRCFEIRHRS